MGGAVRLERVGDGRRVVAGELGGRGGRGGERTEAGGDVAEAGDDDLASEY